MAQKKLAVFDFDQTFVKEDTDSWAMKVRPEVQLKQIEPSACWAEYMQYVFEQVHQAGCTKEEMVEHMVRLVPFPGLGDALEAITRSGAMAIIVSDSNSVFIDAILQKQALRHYFSAIITNPAHCDERGQLQIQRCHAHSCPRCLPHAPNMCKGTLLKEYISANGPFSHVVYSGDGEGDACPSLALGSQDVVFARRGFRLAEALSASAELKATLHVIDFESLGSYLQSYFSV